MKINLLKRLLRNTAASLIAAFLCYTNTGMTQITNNWTNATTGTWTTTSAWSAGLPTGSQDLFLTNGTQTTLNTSGLAKSLTIGGSSGVNTILFNANSSLTVGSDITLASGLGGATLNFGNTNVTLMLNGGLGSIINGRGAGNATINIQGGFSNSLGLFNASTDDLNMGQTGNGTLIINNGQIYNVANLLRLNNSVSSNNATILMNGGILNQSGSEIRFNSGSGIGNTSYLILNSNALVTATAISRQNLGADAAIYWNDGTIGNYAGSNLIISAIAGTMNLKLSGIGTHTFNTSGTNTITVASTALLQDKTGEAGTVVKTGSGTLIFAGSNTYSGSTTVGSGTLLVNSSLLSTNTIVSSGGILGGSGSLQAVTLQGGSLAPGNSPGLLYMTSLNASYGNLSFELGAPTSRGVTYDAIDVQNLLELGSNTTWTFTVHNNYAFQLDDTYDLIDWGSVDTAGFDVGVLQAALPDLNTASTALAWDISEFSLNGTVSVIPEPDTATLLLVGFAGLVASRVYNKKTNL